MNEATQPTIKIYGTRRSAACYAIRDFLHRSEVRFQCIELASDEQARAEAQSRASRINGCRCANSPTGHASSAPRFVKSSKTGLVQVSLASGIRFGDLWRRAGRGICRRRCAARLDQAMRLSGW